MGSRVGGTNTRSTDALTLELTLGALLPVLAMSLLALIVLMAAVKAGLNPLRRLERALQSRDPNDLTPLDVEAPVEVDALVDAINRFMGRLSHRLDAMQRYIETAAHQLRTPLTGIAAQIELLDRARDDHARTAAAARLRKRTSEAGRLANQLLSHATVIHRAEVVKAEPIDLRQVVHYSNADAALDLAGRDLTVKLNVPKDAVIVLGDLVALREALRNLVENAIKHGAVGRISICVANTEEGLRLRFMTMVPASHPTIGIACLNDLLQAQEEERGWGSQLLQMLRGPTKRVSFCGTPKTAISEFYWCFPGKMTGDEMAIVERDVREFRRAARGPRGISFPCPYWPD